MSAHMNAAGPSQGVRAHSPCALVMAGGTGGHIFPGLAVAQALRERGWRVHWLGAPNSMESRLVPPKGFAFETVDFSGVRGKGLRTLATVPWRLVRALAQSLRIVLRVKPDVLVGLGGYITLPGGLMGVLMGKPLVLHEQNSVVGMANRVLAVVARRVFTAFPNVIAKGQWVGNPLRAEFLTQAGPQERFANRTGPLRVLVVGGSLGARALNTVVPQALALIPEALRPVVTHQSGEKQIEELRHNYAAAGIAVSVSVAGPSQDAKAPSGGSVVREATSAGATEHVAGPSQDAKAPSGGSVVREATSVGVTVTPFIDNTAQAFADADWVICRAGASTVTEIAAIGAAALFVPFPSAVDDHQTGNARFLVDQGAGWLIAQSELTPVMLAELLQKTERHALVLRGIEAKKLQKIYATDAVVAACAELCT